MVAMKGELFITFMMFPLPQLHHYHQGYWCWLAGWPVLRRPHGSDNWWAGEPVPQSVECNNGVGGYDLLTRRAFAVPATVSLTGQELLAQSLAGLTGLMGVGDGCLRYSHTSSTGMGLMVEEALGSEEDRMTLFARHGGGSLGSGKVKAIGLVATLAFSAGAPVVPQVIVVETLFAFQTVVVFAKEPGQGVAYMEMVLDFDETQQFVVGLLRAFEDDLVAVIGRDDHDLIIRQDYLEQI